MKSAFTILSFFLLAPKLMAQPANDSCAHAIVVTVGENVAFNTTDATTDGPTHDNTSGCFGFGDNSVQADIWYSFTAPSTTTVEWNTCNQVSFDSRLAIYKAGVGCTPTSDDLLACNDDGAGCSNFTSKVLFQAEQGATYLLRLGGWSGETGAGTFDLFETVPPVPPANDLCANADSAWISTQQEFDDFENFIEGTTVNATFDPTSFQFPPCLGNTGGGEFATVWYWFNNFGNTTLDLHLFKGVDSEGASFIVDMFEACGTQVDTSVILGSCLDVGATDLFGSTTVTNLPEAYTDYLIRVTTRLTTELPGDFFLYIVGETTTAAFENFPGQVKLFPIPVRDLLHLNVSLNKAEDTQIRIFNSLGQAVLMEKKGRLSGFHQFDLAVGDLANGVYTVVVQSESGTTASKFVKQ